MHVLKQRVSKSAQRLPALLYIHLLFTVNEYGRKSTSTTEQHKQAKSKFSSNINHNEHQSRSTEQQIYHIIIAADFVLCRQIRPGIVSSPKVILTVGTQ